LAPPAATPASAKNSEPLTLPIVKEPLTLSYWADFNTNVAATLKSFGEMACYQQQEKRTGIHIGFQHPPVGQETEQFNLLISSGKYPDVIEHNWLIAPGGPAKYVKDKVIIRLNELIDQYAPNLKKLLSDHPDWRRMIVTDEGDIYCFPFIRSDPLLLTFTGIAIRGDWLDKLGLKMPTTIDEWHTVLKAFKEKDPNGNGKADELPFSPWQTTARGGFDRHAFIGAWGITTGYYQEKGVVKYGPLQPEYKEFLKTLAGWSKEGLIDPDFVSTDAKTFDAKITSNQLGSAVMNVGSGIGKYMGLVAGKDANFKLLGAPYPTLKADVKPLLGQQENPYPGQGSAAITASNKHAVETVKMLDFAYSPEGHMLFNFGIEGTTYKLDNGYPRYTGEIMKNPQGLPVVQAMGKYFRSNFNGPFLQDKRYVEQYFDLAIQQEALKTWTQPSNEKLMPPVTPSQDESKKFASIMNDVNTAYDEAFNKIVTGALPLEAWDKFVDQVKQIGIDQALKIQQAALDRYLKRA
jgi:putative aldouronate transport system substrate-binding protein